MGTPGGLEDLTGLAADMGRLEMDRDSCDIVFVVRDIIMMGVRNYNCQHFQVGRDEARVSGHAAVFSVRCSKFVDIVSKNSNSLSAQQQV